LFAAAKSVATDYELIRLPQPVSEDVLTQLVEVTAAINDAPMGDLTYEDEKFDLQRLQDMETARDGRNDTMYRVAARHKASGEIGGHTVVVWNSLRPTRAGQGDTAVARNHRGHKLGILLKIEMMHWIADEHPEVEVIETWNNADNRYMIDVNEAIGYRLSRVFDMYELTVAD
jgi:RimJ/RimL family protein N-acetyltransferase